jgi:two-component system, LuxR family, sensor kinase FixL
MRSFPSVQGPSPESPLPWRGRQLARPARWPVQRGARKAPEPEGDALASGAGARLTAMSAMTATLAHELSQPITASHNYLQACSYLLRQRITGLEDVLAMIEQASEQTRKAGEIIQRMREFMVSGKVQGEREDLRALVATACAGIACPGVELTEIVESVAPGIFVTVDRVQIGQVLTNLVTNAVQALEGCPIRRVTIAAEASGGMVAVRVQDSGRGLSPAALGRLFEPFYTTKASGTGLGLALSRTIAEAHGGELRAESRAGSGAVFILTLPAADS